MTCYVSPRHRVPTTEPWRSNHCSQHVDTLRHAMTWTAWRQGADPHRTDSSRFPLRSSISCFRCSPGNGSPQGLIHLPVAALPGTTLSSRRQESALLGRCQTHSLATPRTCVPCPSSVTYRILLRHNDGIEPRRFVASAQMVLVRTLPEIRLPSVLSFVFSSFDETQS